MPFHPAFMGEANEAIPVYMLTQAQWGAGPDLPPALYAQARASQFRGAAGQCVWTARPNGEMEAVLFGIGQAEDRLVVAMLAAKLPPGDYQIVCHDGLSVEDCAVGWSDGAYRFRTYLAETEDPPRLVIGTNAAAAEMDRQAVAIDRLRDMVNTPAEDMGPVQIQAVISELAERYGASVDCTIADALLETNYPMIHAVGRAGAQAPRFIELSSGDPAHPELALVGKGVAFDTGGLNIKTGSYMRLMKKDMGGAAHAIALAELVMSAQLPVYLKLYVPAVENAISGQAFRPGDILSSRKGLNVEIDNTDAEGRLILADALSRACESDPDLVIDFATLTGAARIALGPDLAPFYTDDEALARAMRQASSETGDPAWQMPLWQPYKDMLKSPIADLVNSAASGFAGSITAAIFLKQFVNTERWMHLDVWAWREAKYGRPAGGAACGLRAVWSLLKKRYG